MTTLVAAIYKKYRTSIRVGFEESSPGITSRFEVFYDESLAKVEVSSVPAVHRGFVN
jgi:hypothetical protein